MLIYKFKNDQFNPDLVFKYCLQLHVSSTHFVLAAFEFATGKCMMLEKHDFPANALTSQIILENIENIFESHHHLRLKDWARVSVCVYNQHFVLAPSSFDSPAHYEELLNANAGTDSEEFAIYDNPLKKLETLCIFGVDKKLYEFFEGKFSNIQYQHSNANYLSALLHLQLPSEAQLFVIIKDQTVSICSVENLSVLFYNSYLFQAKEDLLYYILLAAKTLGYEQDKLGIAVWGNYKRSGEDLRFLRNYLPKVLEGSNPSQLFFPPKFADAPEEDKFELYGSYFLLNEGQETES